MRDFICTNKNKIATLIVLICIFLLFFLRYVKQDEFALDVTGKETSSLTMGPGFIFSLNRDIYLFKKRVSIRKCQQFEERDIFGYIQKPEKGCVEYSFDMSNFSGDSIKRGSATPGLSKINPFSGNAHENSIRYLNSYSDSAVEEGGIQSVPSWITRK